MQRRRLTYNEDHRDDKNEDKCVDDDGDDEGDRSEQVTMSAENLQRPWAPESSFP